MFAASKTSTAVSAAEADPFFTNVTALVNTSGTNGAQNNTFIDSSTNNFTITRNGNTTQGSFSPYGENWSNYFDATNALQTPAGSTTTIFGGVGRLTSTSTFTVEYWVYETLRDASADGRSQLGDFAPSSANNNWGLGITSTGLFKFSWFSGSANSATGNTTIPLNTWTHVAVSISSGAISMYVNGAQQTITGTSTLSATTSTVGYIAIGRWNSGASNNRFYGYISNARIVSGVALYSTTFTPSTVPLQPVAGTSLLTCKDPNIVDDSANQFTITRNGDVSVQKFGPFAGTTLPTPYYGAYFDGSGDVLTLGSNAALAFATGNFTLEMWYYTTVTPTATNVCPYNNGSGNFFLQIRNTAFGIGVVGSAENNAFSFNFVAGQWYHVAVAREGSTVRGFVDGTLVGTGSNSINYGQNGATIGGLTSSSQLITGHLSNLRVVKGQALYTSSFTPSTTPLTTTSQGATAGNVSLLTCQSSQFVDNSTNNFAITAVGNSRPTTFAPFAVTYSSLQPYTPEVFGGSMYFDGNGDSLTAASNAAFALPGDYTFETWLYPAAFQGQFSGSIFNIGTFQTGLFIRVSSTAIDVIVVNSQIFNPTRSTFIPTPNCWYHLALVKSGTTYTLYINGVSIGTATNSSAIPANAVTIGVSAHNSTELYQGYLSGMRLVKGTALYTSSFVPQNAPPAPVTNTSLLLNATNAGIYDASAMNVFETVGNAQVSTSVKKYGTSSVALDGTGDYLLAPNQPYSNFGSGNFTIEAWIYPNVTGEQFVFSKRATSAQFPPIILGVRGNPLRIYFLGSLNGTTWGINGSFVNGSINIPLSTWTHVALVRNGTTFTSYVNGVADLSFTGISGALVTNTIPVVIGAGASDGSNPLNGNIQDLRITNGIARYTATFTPPTAPLPDF